MNLSLLRNNLTLFTLNVFNTIFVSKKKFVPTVSGIKFKFSLTQNPNRMFEYLVLFICG